MCSLQQLVPESVPKKVHCGEVSPSWKGGLWASLPGRNILSVDVPSRRYLLEPSRKGYSSGTAPRQEFLGIVKVATRLPTLVWASPLKKAENQSDMWFAISIVIKPPLHLLRPSKIYRGENKSLQNIAKQDPGRARQNR